MTKATSTSDSGATAIAEEDQVIDFDLSKVIQGPVERDVDPSADAALGQTYVPEQASDLVHGAEKAARADVILFGTGQAPVELDHRDFGDGVVHELKIHSIRSLAASYMDGQAEKRGIKDLLTQHRGELPSQEVTSDIEVLNLHERHLKEVQASGSDAFKDS